MATLRTLAEERNFLIGSAVNASALQSDPQYRDLLAHEFNSVTPENALKFASLRPNAPYPFEFRDADAIVRFAVANRMRVRGHTLAWHLQLPDWLTGGRFSPIQARTLLQDHIYVTMRRYRGRIYCWDVVNEGLDASGNYTDSFWLRTIGPEYIELAFRWAHLADPEAKLFFNAWGAEGINAQSNALYTLLGELLKRGVPIHGIGFQMHIGIAPAEFVGPLPDPQSVLANFRRFAGLGLEIHITEMDVQIQGASGTLQQRLADQAEVYRTVLDLALQVPNVTALVQWGLTDKFSWVPGFTGKLDAPLLFDESYQPKPAYKALLERLSEFEPGLFRRQ